MATIDAAIIKALVEHIGGNPDDVNNTIGLTMEEIVGTDKDANLGFADSCEYELTDQGLLITEFDAPTCPVGLTLRLKSTDGAVYEFISTGKTTPALGSGVEVYELEFVSTKMGYDFSRLSITATVDLQNRSILFKYKDIIDRNHIILPTKKDNTGILFETDIKSIFSLRAVCLLIKYILQKMNSSYLGL